MAKIIPFQGLRPVKHLADKVATLPYDVVNVEEARTFASNPYNFYHITRSEIDLPSDIDVHSQPVYDKAKSNLEQFLAEGILTVDDIPCYYIYEQEMDGRVQTGLICGSSVDDYNKGIIKKHEFTRPEKELDRINHIKTTRAQTGVVFLAYNDHAGVEALKSSWKQQHAPTYSFTAEDGIRHAIWVVNYPAVVAEITELFDKEVPATYIADGHHRAASAAKVCEEFSHENNPLAQHFITCIFPASELMIIDYNRVVKDLNSLSKEAFIQKLENKFTVEKVGSTQMKPTKAHEFGMYIDKEWYRLECKEGTYPQDPIGVLDASILQNNILSDILDIHDPRTDKRVDFVGGIRGLGALETRVNSGDCAAAFAVYPVSIQQLFAVADSGNVMPPKSTWFEPKLRDGLVVYKF